MQAILAPLATLFLGTAILVAGHGLLTTLVPIRAEQLGAPASVTGAIATGYFMGLVVGAWFNPRIIHRVGRIRALAGFAAIFSATSLLMPLAPWPAAWILIRALAGACLAGLTLVIESWLNTVASSAQRGRVLAIYMIVFYGAFGSGQFLLFAYDPAGFELFAIAAVLLGMSLVPIVLTRTQAPEVSAPAPLNVAAMASLSPLAVVGAITSGVILGAFYGLGPLFAVMRGLPPSETGLFMAAAIFGGLVLQWPIGLLSDRIDRRSVILGATASTALASVAIVFVPSAAPILLFSCAALFGGVSFTLYPLSLAHAGDRLPNNADLVSLSSGMLLLYSVGAATGPLIAGQLITLFDGKGLFLFTAAVAAATVLFGFWRVRRTAPPSVEEQVSFVAVPRTSPAVSELDPRQEEVQPELNLNGAAGPPAEKPGL